MSFNSKAYLAYEERRLEPDVLHGTQRRYKDLRRTSVDILQPYPEVSEYERYKREDEWIEQNYKTNDHASK